MRLVFVLAALGIACGGRATTAPTPARPSTRHAQIVLAMKTAERHALVARFRERNAAPGSTWNVNEDALDLSTVVLDPFRGFLRRARRERAAVPNAPARPSEDASRAAHSFVERNADLLGLPSGVVFGLTEEVKASPVPRAVWLVHFESRFPSKGYESFHEIDNVADLDVLVDADAEVTGFINRSRVHPRLGLDLHPALAPEDPRLLAHLVGRTLFALEPELGNAEVRSLRRIPLGALRPEDVTHVQLVIQASPGPELAWMTYRLAYLVEVAKPESPLSPAPFFFFRYIVDPDDASVIEDARPPFAELQ